MTLHPASANSDAILPVARPDLGGNELLYASQAIKSSWIGSTGEFLDRFESEFAVACEANHCLAVTNGTDALHLALLGMGVGPGDEVICPSLTYIATANAIQYCGATPVFADVSMGSWTLDPSAVAGAISTRTRGIIAVHLYGHPADMDALQSLADSHGLWIIEDAAEAHLARYKGRRVGALGRIGTFSFFGNKILTCGEGGAVVFNEDSLYSPLSMLKGQGMDPHNRYSFPILGHNWRMTNIAAAILCAQLERVDVIQSRRRDIYAWYTSSLSDISGVGLQPHEPWAEVAPWLFSIIVDANEFGCSADELAHSLRLQQIDTRPFFRPIHSQPPHRGAYERRPTSMTSTSMLAASGLNLPTFPEMSESDVERVSAAIRGAALTS